MAYKLSEIVSALYIRHLATTRLNALTGGLSEVGAIYVTNPGNGYTSAPSVGFTGGGGGAGAAATAIVSNGQVIGIQVTNPGSNYTSVPGVTFSGGGGGAGAAATAILSATTLDAIATTGLDAGKTALFVAIPGSLLGYIYALVAGTDAESSPAVIRPDDYNAGTNAKVWKTCTLSAVASTLTLSGANPYLTIHDTDGAAGEYTKGRQEVAMSGGNCTWSFNVYRNDDGALSALLSSTWAKATGTVATTQLNGGLFTCLGNIGVNSTSIAGTQILLAAASTTASQLRLPNGAAPSSPVEGDLWNDSTFKALRGYVDGVAQSFVGCLFTATASATITNTTSETTMLGSGVGTKTLPANFLTAGKTLRIRVIGEHTMDATPPSITYRVKLGSTTIASVTFTDANNTNQWFELEFTFTCRTTGATGTVIGQGAIKMTEGTGTSDHRALVMTSTATIDTTAAQAIDVTAQPGTADAGSTIVATNVLIEALN